MTMVGIEPALVDAETAATFLGTSATAMAMQRTRGLEPGSLAVKVGGRVRYDLEHLREWVKTQNPAFSE